MNPAATASPTANHRKIQLPKTSTRLQKDWAHCKVIERIHTDMAGMPFHGKLYAPGAVLEPEELGEDALVMECVGPLGSSYDGKGRRRREVERILWRYDFRQEEWIEICRTSAVGSEWAEPMKVAAMEARTRKPELFDLAIRGRDVAAEIMRVVDGNLERETGPVRVSALSSVYDQIGGRIVRSQ